MSLADVFWEKVDKKGPDECWEWADTGTGGGYGYIGYNLCAHSLSWILHFGNIPEGKLVLHKCDNKRCCNPNHLYLGTYSNNMYDRVIRCPNSFPGVPPKLNFEEIQLIRDLYSTGKYPQSFLGVKFSCDQGTISNVVNKKGVYQDKELL